MLTLRRPLGDMLVAAGLITAEDVDRALAGQRTGGKRLGQVLVEMGLVTEEDVARTLASQLRLPFLPDTELQPDPQAARLLPSSLARSKQMLPLRVLADRALIAVCDPLDVFSLDEVRRYWRREIDLVVVTPRGLERALAQCERMESMTQSAEHQTLAVDEGEAPVVRLVDELITRALEDRASDIHFEPGDDQFRVRVRVDGMLQEILRQSMTHYPALVARVKVLSGLDITERRLPQDGRLELRDGDRNVDIRVSVLPTVHGEKAVLRLFDRAKSVRRLTDLGMDAATLSGFNQAISRSHGMVLVTGPTGSGKTSTLLSALAELVAPERNIVTIEDPVEYLVPGVNHSQINPRAGLTFASGLRSILRQDPDIIMVGEIRDRETADVAVRAALTGHLVLSTLHTGDAAEAVTRLMDMGVEPFLVASAVLGVLAQRLVRTLCLRCRKQRPADLELMRRHGLEVPADTAYYGTGGCSRCKQAGYTGRQAIFEYLPVLPPIQELIHRKATTGELRAGAHRAGLVPMVMAGLRQALAGSTTPEEILRVIDLPTG